MLILFRVDSGLHIGTGHVMRCLAIARALNLHGLRSAFVMRDHDGNMCARVKQEGFDVYLLSKTLAFSIANPESTHAGWLGGAWDSDSDDTAAIAEALGASWIIVDHYEIDFRWEQVLENAGFKILVIDDLADRKHTCDVLLDQTLDRQPQAYAELVPSKCALLLGTDYALLRPEFSLHRSAALANRALRLPAKTLLITMGGVDKVNATREVLLALRSCDLLGIQEVIVLMGDGAPHLHEVMELSKTMPVVCSVYVGASNIAQMMLSSDIAVGAAGGTAWERCCLGLPSIMVVCADNQKSIAVELNNRRAVLLIPSVSHIQEMLPPQMDTLIRNDITRYNMGSSAACLVDGRGVDRLINSLGLSND